MAAQKIADKLYCIPAGSVNTFLIEADDGCALIDAGFPGKAEAIMALVTELGHSARDIRHIVVTHAHPDHIGSLAALKTATGATTYAHPLDTAIVERGSGFRPMTAAPGLVAGLMFRLFVDLKATVEPTKIDVEMHDGEVLPFAGGLRVIHVPGHCAGQVALLWTEGRTLFAGDACANMMGLGTPIAYEDRAEGERSQRKLAGFDFETACFGHGRAIQHGAAKRFRKRWAQA